jgi:hypothetical protein
VSAEARFFFFLASVICFVIAAAGEGWRFGRLGRRGLAPRLVLLPLGLALFVIPFMWDAYKLTNW